METETIRVSGLTELPQLQDGHLEAGLAGALEAAYQLDTAIKRIAWDIDQDLSTCQIVVRMYANLNGVSQALHRAGLCGSESRALAPFFCNFTSAQSTYDFIDTGDKNITTLKIQENFNLVIDNNQCRHCLLYTSPSPRDGLLSRMPSSA